MRTPTLEGKIEVCGYVVNRVEGYEDEGGSHPVLYVAEAKDLHFSGLDIKGKAILTRFDREECTKKVFSLWPPKWPPKISISTVKNTKTWQVQSSEDCYPSEFISDWRLKKNTVDNDLYGYRRDLITNALNQGLMLSPVLLEGVFAPIDAFLMQRYRYVRNFMDGEPEGPEEKGLTYRVHTELIHKSS